MHSPYYRVEWELLIKHLMWLVHHVFVHKTKTTMTKKTESLSLFIYGQFEKDLRW